jgi:hypothetical protein
MNEAMIKKTEVALAAGLDNVNIQLAPYPDALAKMVAGLKMRPRWRAELGYVDRGQGSAGLTLSVYITEANAYDNDEMRSVVHYFPVPPASFDEISWQRWLFDQVGAVSGHEDMENFEINGVKPYAPDHKPGRDPYTVIQRGSWEDAKISFRGEVNP